MAFTIIFLFTKLLNLFFSIIDEFSLDRGLCLNGIVTLVSFIKIHLFWLGFPTNMVFIYPVNPG